MLIEVPGHRVGCFDQHEHVSVRSEQFVHDRRTKLAVTQLVALAHPGQHGFLLAGSGRGVKRAERVVVERQRIEFVRHVRGRNRRQ
jgi:hypothetical protein